MVKLRNIHSFIGLLIVFHFIRTGVEMRLNLFSIDNNDTLTRMMFRANHIYILFTGLTNLLVSYALKMSITSTEFNLLQA